MVTVAKSFEAPIKCEYTKIIAVTFTFAVSFKSLGILLYFAAIFTKGKNCGDFQCGLFSKMGSTLKGKNC